MIFRNDHIGAIIQIYLASAIAWTIFSSYMQHKTYPKCGWKIWLLTIILNLTIWPLSIMFVITRASFNAIVRYDNKRY